MMIENGIVVEIQGRTVTVRQNEFGLEESCFGCMNYECKQNQGHISAVNSFDLPLEAGSQVEIETMNASIAAQTLGALFPLILGFAAGFFFSRLLFPSMTEAAWAFGGVLLMLAAGGIFYLLRRRFPAKIRTVVTRILG